MYSLTLNIFFVSDTARLIKLFCYSQLGGSLFQHVQNLIQDSKFFEVIGEMVKYRRFFKSQIIHV